ncbi:hypothetical protein AB4305_27970 [Nocardia sp. 2YAB30]|uniref:hypothetical protein n=1 Tax=unclassified Nocardia TaxID=2637762 RepID=UPI003F9ACD65
MPATTTLANNTLGRQVPIGPGAGETDQVRVRAPTAAGEVVVVSLPRRTVVAYARAGEVESAAALGPAATQVGVSTGSERVLHNVRILDDLLDSASSLPDVAEFRTAAQRWTVVAS